MTLSEYRGKVVLLDFGHEHCGSCRLAYPRLRAIIDQYRARPFVVLGINNNDNRDVLKELGVQGRDHLEMLVGWRKRSRIVPVRSRGGGMSGPT